MKQAPAANSKANSKHLTRVWQAGWKAGWKPGWLTGWQAGKQAATAGQRVSPLSQTCVVDLIFFAIACSFFSQLVVLCYYTGVQLSKGAYTFDAALKDAELMTKVLLLSAGFVLCMIGSAGGMLKAPSFLAVGIATSGTMLAFVFSYYVLSVIWVIKGHKPKRCVNAGGWSVDWCKPGIMLMLVTALLIFFIFFVHKVCEHWARVSDARYKTMDKRASVNKDKNVSTFDWKPYTVKLSTPNKHNSTDSAIQFNN